MPKRVVDGPGVWKSVKLKEVQPVEFRGEFANLIPLATGNGTFECNPDLILHEVYGFNRPDMTRDKVVAILDEYERVKLLFRWIPEACPNQTWGFWVGIDKPGRLPPPSRTSHEKKGPPPPPPLLTKFLSTPVESMASQRVANGCLGLGMGLGIGMGVGGAGETATQRPSADQTPPSLSHKNTDNGQVSLPEQIAFIQQVAKASQNDSCFSLKSLEALRAVCQESDFTLPEIKAAVTFRVAPMDEFQLKNAGSLIAANLQSDIDLIRRRQEKERATQEMLRASTESEQRKAAEEMAARLAQEQAEMALIEESL